MSMLARLFVLVVLALSFVVLEGCATTQATNVASKRTHKKKRIKKPKTIEGAPLAFTGDELDDDGDDGESDDGEGDGDVGAGDDDGESDLTSIMVAEGHASFYHDSLAGRSTANGERYDPNARTCAHKTLPFGTVLVVEDPSTGKKTTCRVNDRGPFVGGRIIDLSKRVARELGIIDKGVTKVRIRILPKVAS